jgi:hypothetical protein
MTLDPVLMELAGLTAEEFSALKGIVASTHEACLAREAERFVIADYIRDNKPVQTVIVPPDPAGTAKIRQEYLEAIRRLAGEERAKLVTGALEQGMRLATGNFGTQVRSLSFDTMRSEKDGTVRYGVSVGTYSDGDAAFEEHIQKQEWAMIAMRSPDEMFAFTFDQLPPQFRVFIEQAPPTGKK